VAEDSGSKVERQLRSRSKKARPWIAELVAILMPVNSTETSLKAWAARSTVRCIAVYPTVAASPDMGHSAPRESMWSKAPLMMAISSLRFSAAAVMHSRNTAHLSTFCHFLDPMTPGKPDTLSQCCGVIGAKPMSKTIPCNATKKLQIGLTPGWAAMCKFTPVGHSIKRAVSMHHLGPGDSC
jgi:hypothetical protein